MYLPSQLSSYTLLMLLGCSVSLTKVRLELIRGVSLTQTYRKVMMMILANVFYAQ